MAFTEFCVYLGRFMALGADGGYEAFDGCNVSNTLGVLVIAPLCAWMQSLMD